MEKSGILGTKRLGLLFFLSLPWLVLTSACSPGQEVAADQSPPVDGVVFHSPLDAYLINRLGRSQSEIRSSIGTERAAVVTNCMSKAGYSIRPDEVYSAKEARDAEEMLLKDFSSHWAADAIKQLNNPEPVADPHKLDPTSQRGRTMAQCEKEAAVPSARSFDQFDDWVSGLIAAKSQQAQSDERLLNSVDQGTKCIRALGYDVDDFSGLSSQFLTRVNEIVNQIEAGQLSTDEGISQLEAIRSEEAAVAQPVNQCTFREVQVQYDILTEFELQIIDEHGLELDEWAQSIRADLDSR